MPSSPLGSTHCRTMSGLACHHRLWTSLHSWIASGVACHHRPWMANTVKRRQAWHANIAFGQHRRSDGVGRGMPLSPLGSTQSNNVERGMPSSPLGSTHCKTMSGVACHNRLWEAHTVERRRAWHAIIAFGQHTRLNDVGRGKPSSPLD